MLLTQLPKLKTHIHLFSAITRLISRLLILLLLTTPLIAQDLTFEEAYNFSTGDEFVYEIHDNRNPWKGFTNYHQFNKIIHKYRSEDTLFYEIRTQRRAHLYNGNFIKNIYSKVDTLHKYYTHAGRTVTSIRPDSSEFPQFGPYNAVRDSNFKENLNTLCQKHSEGFKRRFVSEKEFSITKKWSRDLGLVEDVREHKNDSSKYFSKRLIYFRKYLEECGFLSDHHLSDLSIREVFDFDIGDHFIYENEYYKGAQLDACLKKVIDKELNEEKEQVTYTYLKTGYSVEWVQTPAPHRIYHFVDEDTIRETYFRINAPVWNMWPAVSSSQLDEDLDTTIISESDACNLTSHAFEYRNFLGSSQRMTIAGKFVRMRGQVQSYIYLEDENETVENWIQIYSNTHGTECGEVDPVLLSGIGDRTLNKDPISLYPNPAMDQLQLYMHNESLLVQRIDFINARGNLVKSIKNTSSNTYDITDLKEGFYVIAILLDGYTIFKKLQIQ